ncbi:hypothetical protein RSAG8_09671, partial [Rhizoctonia solani AG-8 WAC10335]
ETRPNPPTTVSSGGVLSRQWFWWPCVGSRCIISSRSSRSNESSSRVVNAYPALSAVTPPLVNQNVLGRCISRVHHFGALQDLHATGKLFLWLHFTVGSGTLDGERNTGTVLIQ